MYIVIYIQNIIQSNTSIREDQMAGQSNFSSIFVKWVPDEMTEDDALKFFSEHGRIDRIEIVKKMKDGKKIGRMMFVHFLEWAEDTYLAANIEQQHPQPFDVEYIVKRNNPVSDEWYKKKYVLKCCINLCAIPKPREGTLSSTVFDQLSAKLQEMWKFYDADISELRTENERLRQKMDSMEKRLKLVERTDLDNITRFEEINDTLDRILMGESD